jgi:gamma-glutamyltranspeptidase
MLLYTKNRKMVHIDGREVAPYAAYQDMLLSNNGTTLNSRGGPAVAVPGEIKLLDYLFHVYGSKNVTYEPENHSKIALNVLSRNLSRSDGQDC